MTHLMTDTEIALTETLMNLQGAKLGVSSTAPDDSPSSAPNEGGSMAAFCDYCGEQTNELQASPDGCDDLVCSRCAKEIAFMDIGVVDSTDEDDELDRKAAKRVWDSRSGRYDNLGPYEAA